MFPNLNLLNTSSSSLSFLKILNGISKTLGIARQVIPIYKEIEPIVKKVPVFFKKIGTFQNNIVEPTETSNTSQSLIKPDFSQNLTKKSSPTFFQ